MPHAKIHTKSGATITIEGTASEVSAILAQFEGAGGEARPTGQANDSSRRGGGGGEAGPSRLVLDLKAAGFFDKPKTLGDIARALEEKGFLYPVTTLSGVVLAHLKKGQLHRKKVEGKWVYGR